MRDYGKIYTSFWTGETGKLLRGHPEAQIIAFYLIKNDHSTMTGLYFIPLTYIAYETGLTHEGACKGLHRLIEVGYCDYDFEAEAVWVFEMATFQIAGQLKATDKQVRGVENSYENAPNCRFLEGFYEKYKTSFHLISPRKNKPLGSPLPTPLEDPSKPPTPTPTPTHFFYNAKSLSIEEQYDPDFDKWFATWDAKDYLKRGRPEACAEYQIAKTKTTVEVLQTSLEQQQAAEVLMEKHNYKFIVSKGTPANWLRREGWLIAIPTEQQIIANKPPLSGDERKKIIETEKQEVAGRSKIAGDLAAKASEDHRKLHAEVYEKMQKDYNTHWIAHYPHVPKPDCEPSNKKMWAWSCACTRIDKKLGILDIDSQSFKWNKGKYDEIVSLTDILDGFDWSVVPTDGL